MEYCFLLKELQYLGFPAVLAEAHTYQLYKWPMVYELIFNTMSCKPIKTQELQYTVKALLTDTLVSGQLY